MKKTAITYFLITLCSALYGIGVSMFIFPAEIVLGGTGGITVILCRWVPLSAGAVSTVLNGGLVIIGFIVLGSEMGARTLWGASLTALFIYLFEFLFKSFLPLPIGPVLCAVIGGGIIASATGFLFALGSSSGGTDVIALIVGKCAGVGVGGGLLVADVLTVLVGSLIAPKVALASAIGFSIKVIGADVVTRFARGRVKNNGLNG